MTAINPAFLGTLISRVTYFGERVGVHECICVYVHVCVCGTWMWLHVEKKKEHCLCGCVHVPNICVSGSQKSTLGVFFPVYLDKMSHWTPKLIESISLASQPAPRLLLALPLQCWDYRHMLPTLRFLTWILRNQTQILMLAVQTLSQLLSP